jgi:cytochrome P450
VLAGAPAGFEHLPNLRLTGRVIAETLRMYPAGWILTRTVTTATHLGGYAVLPGTTVVLSPYLVHHRRDVFVDPECFDPDRWDRTPTPQRNAFVPFGGGARRCVGDQFAVTEAVLALATITARWRLDPLPGQRVRPAAAVALHPSGLRMRATARTGHLVGCSPNGGHRPIQQNRCAAS